MSEIKITKDNFSAEVISADKPVLVDFWASWCGPCMMLAPVIEEIAKEYEGIVKVGKVNVDEEPELSAQFGIESIPTLIVFENGKIINRAAGFRPKADIEALIK